MDSDTSDRQILDVATDYQSGSKQPPTPVSPQIKSAIKQAFPAQPELSSSKLEMVIQGLGMIAILLIVTTAAIWTVNRLQRAKTEHHLTANQDEAVTTTPSHQVASIEQLNFQVSLPSDWQMQTSDDMTWKITTNKKQTIRLLATQTNIYLTSDRVESIKQTLSDWCSAQTPSSNCTLTNKPPTTHSRTTLEIDRLSFILTTDEDEKLELPLWLIRLNHKSYDTLVIFSLDQVTTTDFEEVFANLQEL